ncbi:hypothetical protein SASPL_152099 [Salvia splendens]|uniref:Uncharacterized protein n=1 Tax=Salvia splendens TaxID=180675 RepID=A0A8X8W2Z9_SALSN|nr:hypothetical protein SASPL_152099 [Salvia splendens]
MKKYSNDNLSPEFKYYDAFLLTHKWQHNVVPWAKKATKRKGKANATEPPATAQPKVHIQGIIDASYMKSLIHTMKLFEETRDKGMKKM